MPVRLGNEGLPLNGIDLLPSPHDRLDPLAAAVRWWTSRLLSFTPAKPAARCAASQLETTSSKIQSGPLLVSLKPADAFVAMVRLPPASSGAHRKAIQMKLPDHAPISPNELHTAATRTGTMADGAAVYAVAMARRARIARLEEIAQAKGARTVAFHPEKTPDVLIRSDATRRAQRRSMVLDLGLFAFLCVAVVTAIGSATEGTLMNVETLTAMERGVRSAAVARERAAADAELASAIIDQGVLNRRPGQLAEDLAAINIATPENAWWTRMRWSAEGVDLTGSSADAAAAIRTLSEGLPGWSVSLGGAVSASGDDGAQQFQLRMTRRETQNAR